jgi:hypothetical protein
MPSPAVDFEVVRSIGAALADFKDSDKVLRYGVGAHRASLSRYAAKEGLPCIHLRAISSFTAPLFSSSG